MLNSYDINNVKITVTASRYMRELFKIIKTHYISGFNLTNNIDIL